MRRVRQELGLVLAGDFELAALLGDLTKEPGVLDGQGRLGGEGAEQPHGLRLELAGGLARHRQHADDLVLTQERHAEQRAMSGLYERPSDRALIVTRGGNLLKL